MCIFFLITVDCDCQQVNELLHRYWMHLSKKIMKAALVCLPLLLLSWLFRMTMFRKHQGKCTVCEHICLLYSAKVVTNIVLLSHQYYGIAWGSACPSTPYIGAEMGRRVQSFQHLSGLGWFDTFKRIQVPLPICGSVISVPFSGSSCQHFRDGRQMELAPFISPFHSYKKL